MLKPLTPALLALVAGGAFLSPAAARSQATPQATPTPEAGLPPVVWQLTAIELADGTVKAPDDPAKYTIQFGPDGRYAIRADCNRGGGAYTVEGTTLTLESAIVTLIGCPPGSLDTVYLQRLAQVVGFAYEEEDLLLTLADDDGVLRFAASLTGVVWQWQVFRGGDNTEVAPDDPSRYAVQFMDDGTVAVLADCNRGRGIYTAEDGRIVITQIATTRMACPAGSLDTEFLRYLEGAVTYTFREGKLYLDLPIDAGTAEFAATVAEEEQGTPAAG
jgi:heat shock protein HslJ